MNEQLEIKSIPAVQKFETLELRLQCLIDRFDYLVTRLEPYMRPDEKEGSSPTSGCNSPVQGSFLTNVDQIIGKIDTVNDNIENVLVRLDI